MYTGFNKVSWIEDDVCHGNAWNVENQELGGKGTKP